MCWFHRGSQICVHGDWPDTILSLSNAPLLTRWRITRNLSSPRRVYGAYRTQDTGQWDKGCPNLRRGFLWECDGAWVRTRPHNSAPRGTRRNSGGTTEHSSLPNGPSRTRQSAYTRQSQREQQTSSCPYSPQCPTTRIVVPTPRSVRRGLAVTPGPGVRSEGGPRAARKQEPTHTAVGPNSIRDGNGGGTDWRGDGYHR